MIRAGLQVSKTSTDQFSQFVGHSGPGRHEQAQQDLCVVVHAGRGILP
jgi:hypothetical protein